MPKQKTHKGLKKRVKVTGGGKVMRPKCNGSHLMSGTSAKKRRDIGRKRRSNRFGCSENQDIVK